MADIFSRTTDRFGGAFSADSTTISFSGAGSGFDAGLLMQNIQMSYTQQVTRLFEVGSPNVYYVGGRTAGNGSIQRVVGPKKLSAAFYKSFGDVCNAVNNTLHASMASGCGNDAGGSASFTAHYCVITTVGLSIGSADMLINESIGLIFSSFLYS